MKPPSFLLPLAALLVLPTAVFAQDAALDLAPSGASASLGCLPIDVTLSPKSPATLRKPPAGLTAPEYGAITVGSGTHLRRMTVIVDNPPGKAPRLFLDLNSNGDFSDPITWTRQRQASPDGEMRVFYLGFASIPLPGTAIPVQIGLYRVVSPGGTAATKNPLVCFADYYFTGNMTFGAETDAVVLQDAHLTGPSGIHPGMPAGDWTLLIDRNRNGALGERGEVFDVAQPFNIGGVSYEISAMAADAHSLTLVKSARSVPEVAPAPVLAIGRKAPGFTAQTLSGKPVTFPDYYRGRLVLLQFWATWCPNCRKEMPDLSRAFNAYHARGVDFLGVSLDKAGQTAAVLAYTQAHRMPWPQIYDGKYLDAAVAQVYDLHSTPGLFLVDADTGKIVAMGAALRGENLTTTLEQALADRGR